MEINLETWNPKGKRVLLYSGGMDSWLIDKLWNPDVKLFVNLGTKSAEGELQKLTDDVVVVNLKDLAYFERQSDFILPSRNLYLIAIAANYGDIICLGANSTDATHDKTEEFAEMFSDLLTYMYQPQKWTEGRYIDISVEFRKYTKSRLLEMYLKNGGDWKTAYYDSFSCYAPKDFKEECKSCRPCFLKMMAFEDNNINLPEKEIEKYIPYIKEKISENEFKDRLYSKERYEMILKKYGY